MQFAAVTFVIVAAPGALAQESDDELLRAILCELRELRSVMHQGQIVAPLVEANARERVQIHERLSQLEEGFGGVDQNVRDWVARQATYREGLRELTRLGRTDLSPEAAEEQEAELEGALREATRQLQNSQTQQTRLATEISSHQSRLARLEDEFDQMQRQMRNLVATSGVVCESAPRIGDASNLKRSH